MKKAIIITGTVFVLLTVAWAVVVFVGVGVEIGRASCRERVWR